MNAWLLLAACIALEVAATTLLKLSQGFARPWYGVASIMLYSCTFWLLSAVLTKIPLGVAYALWAGVGIAGAALIGILVFKQPLTLVQLGFAGLILIGAVGLQLNTRV